MGAEKQLMVQLNAAVQGKPFVAPPPGTTVNQRGLVCAMDLFDAQRHGDSEQIAEAARKFRDFVEQQIGVRGSDGVRRGACGLYALRPAKAGSVRAECRTTSHCHLHYAWLGAGLEATRDEVLFGLQGAFQVAREECELLREALLEWLWWELSWSAACYVPGIGVLAPCRRHRRGKTHEIVLTSPDRDNLLQCFWPPAQLDDEESRHFRAQARKADNLQQLGFRTILCLQADGDRGVGGVLKKMCAGIFAPVVFWDRLEAYRQGDQLVALVQNMERKGRDDTSEVYCLHALRGAPADLLLRVDPDPARDDIRLPATWDGWTRTTFPGHAEAA